jgi:hypothetical protein
MTTPDWTDVTPTAIGYLTAADAQALLSRTLDVCAMSAQRGDAADVPLFTRPIPQQQSKEQSKSCTPDTTRTSASCGPSAPLASTETAVFSAKSDGCSGPSASAMREVAQQQPEPKPHDYDWMPEARQIAAQCWCDDDTRSIEMDSRLAEAFARRLGAWIRTGALHAQNEEYWRNRAKQQPEPNEWGAGYHDCRTFVVRRLCSQLPPADAIRALDALGWPTDDASLRAVGVMR